MRMRTEQPIWLQLLPSRGLLIYLALAHAAALLSLFTLQLPEPPRWIAALLVLLSLMREVWVHGLQKGARAVRRLHWRSDGQWWLTDGEGATRVYPDYDTHLRRPWLVVLRLKAETGSRWLWLPGDCADADTLRRLRVRLGRRFPTDDQTSPLRGT